MKVEKMRIMQQKRQEVSKISAPKALFIVALLVVYTISSWILRKITNTETYAILGGLLAMAIVYGFFRRRPTEKHLAGDERIQQIIKNAWRAAYFAVFGILAILGVYEDFIVKTPLGMKYVFPAALVGSGIAFLLYYHSKAS